MNGVVPQRFVSVAVVTSAIVVLAGFSAFALVSRQEVSRFDEKAIEPPGAVIAVRAAGLSELPAEHPAQVGWQAFAARHPRWRVMLDQRSALPTLAQGDGIPWLDGTEGEPVSALEARARAFLAENGLLLGDWADQLQLDTAASGRMSDAAFVLTFRQVVDGVPVDGARLDFHVVHGNLVAFGAERLARVKTVRQPRIDENDARAALYAYLDDAAEVLEEHAAAELRLAPIDPGRVRAAAWTGRWGEGLGHVLVWRFRFHAPGESARWVADVDALTGTVVGLHDEAKYERARGGVFPLSSDGVGDEGTEHPDIPMPFANVIVNGVPQAPASASGLFTCESPEASVATTLSGPYVTIDNSCGPVSETVLCGQDIDLQSGPGTNCETPPGASAGNTRGARTAFWHVNRSAERARYWLPDNTWIRTPLTVNVNLNGQCNASYAVEVNMYRAGGGCRNTAELQGSLVHEWGHGLDQNDGGGWDNSSESYGDVVAIYDTRTSCQSRGFYENGTCSGYGDTCLECTGVRELDYAKRQFNRPATPQDFLTNQCDGGNGPCGKEAHCESFPAAEAMWDFAVRDLPASGLDPESAWQLADRLWHQSRKGSGGQAYNCTLPNSDGCGTSSWFHKLRVADDDDGNLNNGTPHAAAIYAAFARHNIACGAATDASNRNSTACPALARPALEVTLEGGALRLDWSAVQGAAKYRILRTEFGCDRAQVPIADVPAPNTTFLDTDLAEGVDVSYRVQAVGSNAACESPVSACRTSAVEALGGRVAFVKPTYACGGEILLEVRDGNAGSADRRARVWSDHETTPEVVLLTEVEPGSNSYRGSLPSGSGTPVAGDGRLVFAAGDQITAEYVDENDGAGGTLTSLDTAVGDCGTGAPFGVRVTYVDQNSATIRWTTPELTTGTVEWGPTAALGNTAQDARLVTEHEVTLSALNECSRYHFRVRARDYVGNETVADVGGTPFAFNTGRIPGFFRDDFESATTNWTLAGEWQVGAPEGKGTGFSDPTFAAGGTRVLGHDLTGLGTFPGNYERNTEQRAISPVIDGSGRTGIELTFQRWLNLAAYGIAGIDVRVNGGAWQTVSTYGGTIAPVRTTAWSERTLSLSGWADGQSNFQIAFRLKAGSFQYTASSWNVDSVVLREAADPRFETCGGCTGAPSFAGLVSVSDVSACGSGGGVTLTWDPAASWGTGTTGTYAVYRDTVPNFTPSAANRLAAGLTETTYTDETAADGTAYHYIVRAENDETCGGGPANGGATDGNTVYRTITPSSAPPAPAAVTAVAVQPVLGPDLRLAWEAASGAADYRVYRSEDPLGSGFADFLTFTPPAATLAGDGADGRTWFYLVRGVNGCGEEGP